MDEDQYRLYKSQSENPSKLLANCLGKKPTTAKKTADKPDCFHHSSSAPPWEVCRLVQHQEIMFYFLDSRLLCVALAPLALIVQMALKITKKLNFISIFLIICEADKVSTDKAIVL